MKRFIAVAFLALFTLETAGASELSNSERISNLEREIENLKGSREVSGNESSVSLHGRLHLTGTVYGDTSGSSVEFLTRDSLEVSDARLGANFKISDRFSFYVEGQYAREDFRATEANITVKFNDNLKVVLGQLSLPFMIGNTKSGNTVSLVDYGYLFYDTLFAPYLAGVTAVGHYEHLGFYAGAYGKSINNTEGLADDVGLTYMLRAYTAPVNNENMLMHLGAGYMRRDLGRDMEMFQTSTPSAGSVKYDDYRSADLFALEAIFVYDFFSIQAEYLLAQYRFRGDAERYSNNFDLILNNNYPGAKFNNTSLEIETTFMLTGEKKIYSRAGFLNGVDVKNKLSKGGYGAFELAGRFSKLDHHDTDRGMVYDHGEANIYAVGLNWIPENYFRVLFEYSRNNVKYKSTSEKDRYNAFALSAKMYF